MVITWRQCVPNGEDAQYGENFFEVYKNDLLKKYPSSLPLKIMITMMLNIQLNMRSSHVK